MRYYLEYKDYIGSVDHGVDDALFYGKIEYIPALVSYEGSNPITIRLAFRDAVDDYVAYLKDKLNERN